MSELTKLAHGALAESDRVMLRVYEGVALGLTTISAPDVVAFVEYRRALRNVASGSDISGLPKRPAFPQGT